jgi:predicted transcriptional regulator
MFILRGILRAESQEQILVYLLVRETGYGKAIAEFYGASQNSIQKQLVRLEADGVVVSRAIGKLREYQLNPRYPFIAPLKELLKIGLSAYPKQLQNALTIQRTRPRKAEKSLKYVEGNRT